MYINPGNNIPWFSNGIGISNKHEIVDANESIEYYLCKCKSYEILSLFVWKNTLSNLNIINIVVSSI